MRRISIFVLACLVTLLFSVSGTSMAEEAMDLSSLSTEELLSLQNQITDTLYSKGGLVPLPGGEYVAGIDIAPGSYVITFLKNEYDSGSVEVTVYTSSDAKVKYNSAYDDYRVRWTLIEEAVKNNSSVQITEPAPFDATAYYVSKNEPYAHDGEKIRVTISEGQMLFVKYDAKDFNAVIEKAPGLFME